MRALRFAAACLFTATAAADAGPSFETDTMRLVFGSRDEGYGLARIVNKLAGGVSFAAPSADEADLWELRIVGKGNGGTNETLHISNRVPCSRTTAQTPDKISFAWRDIDLPGEPKALDVFVEVKKDGSLARWSITSRFRSTRWALHTTVFPYVRHVADDGEADVLLPWKNMGARLVRSYDSSKEPPHLSYSPSCKPPLMAFFKGAAMLYIAAHDPDWRFKEMRYRPGGDFLFATEAENCGVPGKAEGSPRGGFVMACGKGDWWQAARLYRAWAIRQKWCAKGRLVDRADFTRRAAETELWTLNHGSEQTFSNHVAAMAKAWPDVGVSAKWQRLSAIGSPQDQNCIFTPEWYPMRPKVPETVKWAKSLGFLVMPYTNGRIWEEALASWTLAEPYACLTPRGTRHCERYVGGRRYGVMCPACPQWQKVVANVTRRLVDEEPHANAVYIDQVSCSPPYPCVDPLHGHPLGGGKWWCDSLRSMMEPIHAEAHCKGIVLTSEQFGDCVLDLFDAFLNATEHCADDVPFFPAVYSGYAIYYGTEVHWKDDDAARFALCARTFSWGVAIGWIPGYELVHPAFKTHAPIYHAFGRARKAARDYLAYGSLVDELRPLDPLPDCSFRWWRTEKNRGREAYTNSMPAVIGTIWRDARGTKTAALSINISGERQTLRFLAPAGDAPAAARAITGQPMPSLSIRDGVIALTLEPRQIALIEQPEK